MTTNSEVIVELVVKNDPTNGAKAFEAAMGRAEAAVKKTTMSMQPLADRTTTLERKLDSLRRSADPLYASTKRLETATRTLDLAMSKGLITDIERARTIDLLNAKYKVNAVVATDAAAANTLYARSLAVAGRGGGAILGAAGLAGGGFAGFAVVGLAMSLFVKNSVEAQSALAQLQAVIQSTGGAAGMTAGELTALASEMQRVTTFGDDAVLAAESMLLTFTKIGKDVFPQATATALDMSAALGQDLKNSSIQLGKALNDPIKGVTALQRVGVTFTTAQREMIQALVETGNVADAQRLILRELQTEFGGSAAAARNTLGGALTALGNAFGDLFEVSGEGSRNLVDSINRITDTLSDPATIRAIQDFGAFLFNAMSVAVRGLVLFIENAEKAAVVMRVIANPAGAATLVAEWQAIEERAAASVAALDAVAPAAANAGGAVSIGMSSGLASTEQLAAATAALTYQLNGTKLPAENVAGTFQDAFGDAAEAARKAADVVRREVDIPLPRLREDVGEVETKLFDATAAATDFGRTLAGGLTTGKGLADSLAGALGDVAGALGGDLLGSLGSSIGGGIGSTLGSILGPLGSAIGNAAGGLLGDLFGDLFGGGAAEREAERAARQEERRARQEERRELKTMCKTYGPMPAAVMQPKPKPAPKPEKQTDDRDQRALAA